MEELGGYVIQRELGRGASARVVLAVDPQSHHSVCLKIFHRNVLSDSNALKRVRQEFETASRLRHPQIVQSLKASWDTDPPYLVMNYIEGWSLEAFQNRLPYVIPELSVLLVLDLLETLHFAHQHGVIHRDLKPDNVIVDHSGRLHLTDFGLAKSLDHSLGTQSNSVLGSPDFMSPEQARGERATVASDLFSVGGILYFLVTGTRPFNRHSPLATLNALIHDEPEPPQKKNPKIPSELSRCILKALAKNIGDRFQHGEEFVEELKQYLASCGWSSTHTPEAWLRDPSGFVIDSLRTCSQHLIEECRRSLQKRSYDDYVKSFSHLALKAPSSPSLQILNQEYELSKKQSGAWKRRALGAGATVAATLLGLCGYHNSRLNPSSQPAESSLSSKPVALAQPQISQSVSSIKPELERVAETTKSSVKAAAKKFGIVRFSVPEDVTVRWNGKVINPKRPLRRQPVGTHDLVLIKKGHSPIQARVEVKSNEPTVVEVNP